MQQGSLRIFSKYPGALCSRLASAESFLSRNLRMRQPANGWGVQSATAFILFRMLVFGRSGASVTTETYRLWCVEAEDIAHFIGTCIPAISSYIGNSCYTFRKR
jgi:hypothetical protein